ncbi:dnaJ homolog subfamily C member 28-like [Penaeus japonicus]|uniref:dnaJ homolog subfamily C member 28-like n=1 Tax=Penaeus japonicus TaxID=27405 RepID=UPI001C70B2A5|nr:dnaJ homolog subfamily C member 28-like [Penaeus japonicus]XP_042879075.1 dnaJ homolog subfamily C member 28-like [Penaeus japonicus]
MLTLSRRLLPIPSILNISGGSLSFSKDFGNRASDYDQYFEVLGLRNDSDQATVRDAFIKLAKKYHPDGGYATANAVKFQQIEKAYRKLMEKFSSDRHNHNNCEGEFGLYYEQKMKQKIMEEFEEEKEDQKRFDVKQTAPQHRQYLSYEGIGIGTPSQRQNQYSKFQVLRASENVIDYKVKQISSQYPETSLVDKDRIAAKKIRTRYGIDRIVDDMIQEAMARGDFDNLSNAGKPLESRNHNPYVDTVTHKLNEVLINNGYAPEWVMLEKEIRLDRNKIREALLRERRRIGRLPLSPEDEEKWKSALNRQAESISELNKKINKYNLLVPILSKQTVHFPLARESEKVLTEGLSKDQIPAEEAEANGGVGSGSVNSEKPSSIRKLFDLLTVLRNP